MADKKAAAGGVQKIIIGTVLQATAPIVGVLLGFAIGFTAALIAMLMSIAGFVLFLLGLIAFKLGFDDEDGIKGSQFLFIAAIIGIAAAIVGIIPVIGILGTIASIVAFVFLLLGYMKLKTTTGYSEEGRKGAGLLFIGAIISIVGAVVGFIPVAGTIVSALIALGCLVLYLMGWTKIKKALNAA